MVRALLLAVFSDSHGSVSPMRRAVLTHRPDMVLHLGDYARDAEELRDAFPDLDIRFVRGNCDMGSAAPDRLFFELEGVPIFMTHGHLYSVKYTLDSLANAAHFAGAKLALYGHTHRTDYCQMGALTLVNPGSAGMAEKTFALLKIKGGTFECSIQTL